MINFLKETEEAIKHSNHTPEDIIFIGSANSGHCCTWEVFKILANNDYDEGYGAADVAIDLIIVFSDNQKLWRGEYDGSEWWEYSIPFKMPEVTKDIKNLFCSKAREIGSAMLGELN